jgi:vacuolar-type H+-ATPase subunit H
MDSDLDPTYSRTTGTTFADDDRTTDDTTNEEIERTRAEIEATRTDMAETLEAIKDKLNPADLMDQAKEKVTEMADSLADKAKDTVHHMMTDATSQAKDAVTGAVTGTVDTAKEAVSSVVETAKDAGTTVLDTIKRNPIPSALAAFGAVWLYMKNRDDSRAHTSYSMPSSSPGGSMMDRSHDANHVPARSVTSGQNLGGGLMETIQRNPIPAAATAAAAAWLYLKNKDENKVVHSPDTAPFTGSYGVVGDNGNGHGMMDTAREKAGHVMDAAGNLVSSAKDKASHLTESARETASHLTEAARGTASNLTEKAKEQVGAIGTHASHMSSSVSESFQNSPLPIGMVALGVGMAVGLLVPESERENQWMGAARDRLVDKAQETVHDIAGKVQTVAQETLDVAKTTAQEQAKAQGLMGDEQANASASTTDEPAPMDQMQDAFANPGEETLSDTTQRFSINEEI